MPPCSTVHVRTETKESLWLAWCILRDGFLFRPRGREYLRGFRKDCAYKLQGRSRTLGNSLYSFNRRYMNFLSPHCGRTTTARVLLSRLICDETRTNLDAAPRVARGEQRRDSLSPNCHNYSAKKMVISPLVPFSDARSKWRIMF